MPPVSLDGATKIGPVLRSSKSNLREAVDNNYEFSAPQYYDFAEPSPGMPPSESWFGTLPQLTFQ